MPRAAASRRRSAAARKRTPAAARVELLAKPASRDPSNQRKLQLKLRAGLKSTQKKAIIDKASVVTAGQVRPLFGGSGDPELETYYIIDVPSASKAEKAISKLRGTKGVELISAPAVREVKTPAE